MAHPIHGLPDEKSYYLEYKQFYLQWTKLWQAWEEFQKKGDLKERDVVRPEVLASWKRCRARGLNPYDSPNKVCLSDKDIEERLKRNRILVEVASPFLKTLVKSVKGSMFRVDLFDKDLYLLAQFSDDDSLKEALKHGSSVGVNRNEVNCGTSAINLAAHLQRPVQLVGPEHYNINLHYWTCSATPIFSPKKDFLGVINMAGHFSLFHKHTLGMVIAVGKVIEQSLQQRELIENLEIANEYLNNIIHAVSDGLIVVDVNGFVTTLNRAASNFLGIKSKEAIGRNVSDLLGENNVFQEAIKSGLSKVNKEITMKTPKGNQFFVATLEPVVSKQDRKEIIGIFKPMSSARGFIKNLAGLRAHFTFSDLIGEEAEFKRIVELAKQAAGLANTILLQGESGTGKELFAQAIHNASPVKDGPFVALNCAAIPGELIESELFGYEGGAFTGAKKDGRPGKFELAEGGTIFLDEINSMPLNMQVKLLRVLQTKTIMRVGGVTEIAINAKLVCATNQDLWRLVQEGSFREDLFYRINVLTIVIPPLRERLNDIPLLVKHFCRNLGRRLGVELGMEEKVFSILQQYHWPGNVRELENVVERSAILALSRNSRIIQEQDIMSYPGIREFLVRSLGKRDIKNSGEIVPTDLYNLEKLEITAIRRALIVSEGNLSRAAQLLGIARSTLYRKIKQYQIDCSDIVHL
ncbi:PAS fold [Moorella glycerini]|uniref:Acetoin dehydrogenase operon transcriptional activator AcoR n=1 Tax=Neomoorella stamsii TaxID=1266720 RepID=A0A9X7J1H2_9FIRM|nr:MULTISPECIES: sigma 54-interacting transcriptional regulator [Moorella]PRR71513.1 Acetoin dehydrogenase operon transcriptional activator AcoR [Moorella stamsii]CEP68724.1 PAS fold [Moorella glycerini]